MMKKKILIISLASAMLMMYGCGNSAEYDVKEITGSALTVEEGQAVSFAAEDSNAPEAETEASGGNVSDKTEKAAASDGDKKTEKETEANPKNESENKAETKPASISKIDSGHLRINDKAMKIGMIITDSFISSLGIPDDIQNAPSCHYDGSDTIYCYDGYSLYTYANGSKNYLYLVEIDGSGISTELGIHVGSSVNDVKAAYGNPSSETGTSLVYSLSSCTLRFNKSGSTVTGINYEEK